MRKQLKNNKDIGTKKLNEIFSKYVAKQEGLSSEESASENEENDSYGDETDENSSDKNEMASKIRNKDNQLDNEPRSNKEDENSFKSDKSSTGKKKIIRMISSDDDSEVENKETSQKSNGSDASEVNKENIDNVKSSALEELSSTKKVAKSINIATNIKHDNQVQEKTQASKKINEAVTILSEICKVNDNLSNEIVDEIEILSDSSNKNKEHFEEEENESSQDIILEIEDETEIADPLSISKDNEKEDNEENHMSTLVVNHTHKDKKKEIKENKSSGQEIKIKSIVVAKYPDKKDTKEKDSKNDNGNNSNKILENNVNGLKKINVGKVYPLQARDNHEKLVKESVQSRISQNSSTIEGNENIMICDTFDDDYEVPNNNVIDTFKKQCNVM